MVRGTVKKSQSLTWKILGGDSQASEGEALPKRVGDSVLFLGEDLCHHQQVVEEEHLPLVHTDPLLLADVRDLVEAAITHEAAVWEG